jgi:glycyl-tRNA synthetase beta subunit
MVMSENPAERDNRLRLLNRFVALFSTFADFSLLAG